MLATVGDAVTRDSKKYTGMSPERLFFIYTRSERLHQTDASYIDPVELGDLDNASARNFSRDRKYVFGMAQPVKQKVPTIMKKLCQQGGRIDLM